MKHKQLVIDGATFQSLVSGEEVTKDGVKVILSDIGFDNMIRSINRAKQRQQKKRLAASKDAGSGYQPKGRTKRPIRRASYRPPKG